MNIDLERTRRVLARQQAWQEAKRDRADMLGLREITRRLDWLAQQPALPPEDPGDWLLYTMVGTPAPTAPLAAPRERPARDWSRPASLATGTPAPQRRPSRPTFTDRQLAIAIAVLEARENA